MADKSKLEAHSNHRMIALEVTDKGIVARCVCGWNSGQRFSSLIASAAFSDHAENRIDRETR